MPDAPDPEKQPEPPIELQPNPAVGILRFFIYLMPTAIVVGCLMLDSWLRHNAKLGIDLSSIIVPLGAAGIIGCGWFDSMLALNCRLGKRSRVTHVFVFTLTEVILVIPALLFAILYAICLSSPW